jgi:hypothetical protein
MEKYTYKIFSDGTNEVILRSDGGAIPKDLGNVDYQEYLKSLEAAEPTTIN